MNDRPHKSFFRFRPPGKRPMLRPAAVALVALIFAALFFSSTMVHQKKVESTLLQVLTDKAVHVVETLEKASEKNNKDLVRLDSQPGVYGGSSPGEPSELQDFMVKRLVDLADYVDQQQQRRALSREELQRLSSSEKLQAIAVIDREGRSLLDAGSPSPMLLARVRDFMQEQRTVAVNLYRSAQGGREACSFVIVRRRTEPGVVALVISPEGLRRWGRRIAVQQSVDEIQWDQSIAYIVIKDSGGWVLADSGDLPPDKVATCLMVSPAAVNSAEPITRCVTVGDRKILELSVPFRLNGKVVGSALVGLETAEVDRLLHDNRRHVLLWTGFMIAIGIVTMTVFYRTQNRHATRLSALNERLHQAQRLSSLGKLGAGMAHEIRNPLNSVSMAVQRLQREFLPDTLPDREEYEHITQVIREELKRLNMLVEDFLLMARNGKVALQHQSIVELVRKTIWLIQPGASAKGIEVNMSCDKGEIPDVFIDADKMQQVLLNLLRNAEESISGGGGKISIAVEPSGKESVIVRFTDNGTGIPAEEIDRIFDPYYTTKQKGLGLGLTIAYEIVQAHGGELRVESRPGHGTIFEIQLPRAR